MKKDLMISLGWGAGIVVLALIASYARKIGVMDQESVERVVLGATGLMVAAFGNRMPKTFAPTAAAQQVARVGGWSLAISGLIYAALWAFAPFQIALVGGVRSDHCRNGGNVRLLHPSAVSIEGGLKPIRARSDGRDIRRVFGLHADHIIPRIDVVDFTRDTGREIAAQI